MSWRARKIGAHCSRRKRWPGERPGCLCTSVSRRTVHSQEIGVDAAAAAERDGAPDGSEDEQKDKDLGALAEGGADVAERERVRDAQGRGEYRQRRGGGELATNRIAHAP